MGKLIIEPSAYDSSRPYTLNVLSIGGGIAETHTKTFGKMETALRAAREEVKWEFTVHATVTNEINGQELFDEAGDFY